LGAGSRGVIAVRAGGRCYRGQVGSLGEDVNAVAGNVRPASAASLGFDHDDGPAWLPEAAGRGSIAVLLVARWLLGMVMRGGCRAWPGRACCGPGRPVRVEDLALTDDPGNHGAPESPGRPNIPRFFPTKVTSGLRVRGAAGVAAGVRRFGPSERDRRFDREPPRDFLFAALGRTLVDGALIWEWPTVSHLARRLCR
jgi:hypothetical protein